MAPDIHSARYRISDGKYVVFKVENFYKFCNEYFRSIITNTTVTVEPIAEPLVVKDGTVIRAQDVFSAPALHAYANSILVALEMVKVVEGGSPTPLTARLQAVADYFHGQAVKAEITDYKKLPD